MKPACLYSMSHGHGGNQALDNKSILATGSRERKGLLQQGLEFHGDPGSIDKHLFFCFVLTPIG